MSIEIGKRACWRKGPTGDWLIWGRHDLLESALATGKPVETRRHIADDTIEVALVEIERVCAPNHEGWAYAHPVGTATSQNGGYVVVQVIPQVRHRARKPRIRRHR